MRHRSSTKMGWCRYDIFTLTANWWAFVFVCLRHFCVLDVGVTYAHRIIGIHNTTQHRSTYIRSAPSQCRRTQFRSLFRMPSICFVGHYSNIYAKLSNELRHSVHLLVPFEIRHYRIDDRGKNRKVRNAYAEALS